MPLLQNLALAGRLSDRLSRRAARRRLLARPDRLESRASRVAADRFGGLVEGSALAAPWRPGEMPGFESGDDPARQVLGERRLEAACHWPVWAKNLAAAENELLGLVAKRSGIAAEHRTLVVAGRRDGVSGYLANELGVEPLVWTPRPADAERIRRDHERLGLGTLVTRSGDLGGAVESESRDYVIALEMLPEATDLRAALAELSRCLRPGGRLFLQLACHRRYAYRLSRAEAGWLGLEAGGLVPATDLAPRLLPELALLHHWELSGEHYERTARAWRERLEERRDEIVRRIATSLGRDGAERALVRWRLSLLAREELFGARGGQEWWVSQYLFGR